MSVPAGFTALFTMLSLMANLTVSDGVACRAPESAAHMQGMEMEAKGPSAISGSTSLASAVQAPAPSRSPCDLPGMPGGCSSMGPCAPCALAVQRVIVQEIPSGLPDVAAVTVLQPSSETKTPELPPPRA